MDKQSIEELEQGITELEIEIEEKEELLLDKRAALSKLQQALAEQLCPFKVGDLVISPRGNRQIVAEIQHADYGKGYNFTVFNFKKDGTPYKNANHADFFFDNGQQYKKVEENA